MTTPQRNKLPPIRPSITVKEDGVCGFDLFVIVGFYDTEGNRDSPGEIFCIAAKHGSEIAGLLDGFCIMVSKSLQYGVAWKDIRDTFRHTKFGSSSLYHKSLLDGLVQMVDKAIKERKAVIGIPSPEDGQFVKEVIGGITKTVKEYATANEGADAAKLEKYNSCPFVLCDNSCGLIHEDQFESIYCDKSIDNCRKLGNEARFGGSPILLKPPDISNLGINLDVEA